MSDTRTAPQGNGAEQAVATTTTALPDDILSRIVSETERQIRVQQARPSPVHLRTWEEIERFAEKAARSGMVPKDYVNKPDAIVIAVQMGSELGLPPVQALQNIAVVNGKPSVYGDGLPGLCRSSGMCSYIKEWHEGEGDTLTYWCEAKRKDQAEPIRSSFGVAEARTASLWGKAGPWTQYPTRMMQMRARGFCLRDAFPDVLRGLISAEEAEDYPEDVGGKTPPPVGTDKPILPQEKKASPAKPPPPVYEWPSLREQDSKKWLANFLRVADECASAEEVTELTKQQTVVFALANAPERVKRDINDKLADAWARLEKAKIDERAGPAWDDDSDAVGPASLDGVLPKDLQNPPAPTDAAEQEAATLLAAYRSAPTRQALDSLKNSMRADVTTKMLTNKGDGATLKRLDDAYETRSAELRAKPETP